MKFLYQPLTPFRINQGFGENKSCIDLTTNKVFSKNPYLDSTVCPPGSKSVYSNMNGHNGLDLYATRWQPIYAAQNGMVDEVSTEIERGLGVGIRTKAPDGKWYRHRYWHLIALDVEQGDQIQTGDLIGYADSTGFSSGDHLHFELKEVDINGRVLNQGNGYFGAIDPIPFMEPIFALEIKGLKSKIELIREQLAILTDKLSDWLRNKV